MERDRMSWAWCVGIAALIPGVVLALLVAGCVSVEVHTEASNQQARAAADVRAGYGEAGAGCSVTRDGDASSTATRSANTVEALGGALIGAAGSMLLN